MKKHIAEMVGKKFNYLTVVTHYSREKGYVCRCDCGRTTIVKIYSLKTGRQKSCGCGILKRKVKENSFAAKNSIYKNYRGAARRRSYDFTLTQDEFFSLITQNCNYCGSKPSLKTYLPRHQDFRYNGVDRIDNAIGYTKENCVACCDICNSSKSTLSMNEWLNWLKQISKFQGL